MEPDPSFFASLSDTHSQSLSDEFGDLFVGEDSEDDDLSSNQECENSQDDDLSSNQQFMCPFCGEIQDTVALINHIHDQHPPHLNNEECPVCAETLGMELVGHIFKEHGYVLKVQRKRKRRSRRGRSNPTLRIEQGEETRNPLFGDFSCIAPSICELDPLLSSFISTPVLADQQFSAQVQPSPLEAIEMQSLGDDFLEREPEPLDKDQAEKARRSEFVQKLLMSAILDNNLPMKL